MKKQTSDSKGKLLDMSYRFEQQIQYYGMQAQVLDIALQNIPVS